MTCLATVISDFFDYPNKHIAITSPVHDLSVFVWYHEQGMFARSDTIRFMTFVRPGNIFVGVDDVMINSTHTGGDKVNHTLTPEAALARHIKRMRSTPYTKDARIFIYVPYRFPIQHITRELFDTTYQLLRTPTLPMKINDQGYDDGPKTVRNVVFAAMEHNRVTLGKYFNSRFDADVLSNIRSFLFKQIDSLDPISSFEASVYHLVAEDDD